MRSYSDLLILQTMMTYVILIVFVISSMEINIVSHIISNWFVGTFTTWFPILILISQTINIMA